jgi:hypothetical protein
MIGGVVKGLPSVGKTRLKVRRGFVHTARLLDWRAARTSHQHDLGSGNSSVLDWARLPCPSRPVAASSCGTTTSTTTTSATTTITTTITTRPGSDFISVCFAGHVDDVIGVVIRVVIDVFVHGPNDPLCSLAHPIHRNIRSAQDQCWPTRPFSLRYSNNATPQPPPTCYNGARALQHSV